MLLRFVCIVLFDLIFCSDRSQANQIRKDLLASGQKNIKVSTVDAFQGGEKDIIFLSTVRTSKFKGGFMESAKRLNVAITRAKRHLIIVCHAMTLSTSEVWRQILSHADLLNAKYLASSFLTAKDFGFLRQVPKPAVVMTKKRKLESITDDMEDEDQIIAPPAKKPKIVQQEEQQEEELLNDIQLQQDDEEMFITTEPAKNHDIIVDEDVEQVTNISSDPVALNDSSLIADPPSIEASKSTEQDDAMAFPFDTTADDYNF